MTKRGEAAAIVPSEMKGRKHPMTDDEFMWLLERERRELVTAGRPTIDRGWKTRQVTGAMVSVAAPDRAGTTTERRSAAGSRRATTRRRRAARS